MNRYLTYFAAGAVVLRLILEAQGVLTSFYLPWLLQLLEAATM